MNDLAEYWIEEYVGQCDPVDGCIILDFVAALREAGFGFEETR